MPVYGSWCGKGYPSEGYSPTAVDSWDEACEEHDECYGYAEGDPAALRACDDEFLDELEDLNDGRPVPQEMRNAFSWFSKGHTGQLFVWVPAQDEIWALAADCDGSDGEPARFCEAGDVYCELPRSARLGTGCYCQSPYTGLAAYGEVIESY
jgi:hypothetical protein